MSIHPVRPLIGIYIQKVLPAVYDDSLSYYEILCKALAKINEMVDVDNNIVAEVTHLQSVLSTIDDIPALSEQVEALEETAGTIQSMLESLPDYTEFQTLETRVSDNEADIATLKEYVKTFDNVAEMCAYSEIADGEYYATLGYYDAWDGGGGIYTTSESTPNGIDVLAGNNVTLELVAGRVKNVKQYGARSNVDSYPNIQRAIDMLNEQDVLYVPAGSYPVSRELNVVQSSVTIMGDGTLSSGIRSTADFDGECVLLLGRRVSPFVIHTINMKQIRIDGRPASVHGCMAGLYYSLYIDDCSFFGDGKIEGTDIYKAGLTIIACLNSFVNNCKFMTSTGGGILAYRPDEVGIGLLGPTKISNCIFYEVPVSVQLLSGGNQVQISDNLFYTATTSSIIVGTKAIQNLEICNNKFTSNALNEIVIEPPTYGLYINIHDNTFIGSVGSCIFVPISKQNYIFICNNRFIRCCRTPLTSDVTELEMSPATNGYYSEIILFGGNPNYAKIIKDNIVYGSGGNYNVCIKENATGVTIFNNVLPIGSINGTTIVPFTQNVFNNITYDIITA